MMFRICTKASRRGPCCRLNSSNSSAAISRCRSTMSALISATVTGTRRLDPAARKLISLHIPLISPQGSPRLAGGSSKAKIAAGLTRIKVCSVVKGLNGAAVGRAWIQGGEELPEAHREGIDPRIPSDARGEGHRLGHAGVLRLGGNWANDARQLITRRGDISRQRHFANNGPEWLSNIGATYRPGVSSHVPIIVLRKSMQTLQELLAQKSAI